MAFSSRWYSREVLLSLTLCIALALAVYGLWTYTAVGCVPHSLPHWLPIPIQIKLEVRCHA